MTRWLGRPVRVSSLTSFRVVSMLAASDLASRRVPPATIAHRASPIPMVPASAHNQFMMLSSARSGAQLNQPTMRPRRVLQRLDLRRPSSVGGSALEPQSSRPAAPLDQPDWP